MFRKKKEKNNNVDHYVKFISKIVKDEKIKKEIIEQLDIFSSNGKISIDGNNLTGKILDEQGNLYLDIKYENNKLLCSYTKWDINSVVLIEQEGLKSGDYKITVTDKTKYRCFNKKNKYSIKIEERIYNENNQLLYESENMIEEEFDSYSDRLIYVDDSPFVNIVKMEKTWYMPNGSIINYKMSKDELYSKKGIKEDYSICVAPCETLNGTTMYFSSIPKELYISIMTGELTLEDALDSLNKKDPVKMMGKKDA